MNGRGSSGDWLASRGAGEYRHTRSTAALDPGACHNTVFLNSMRRGLQVYDRVGEGRGKSARKPAGEERGEIGGQG